MAYFHVELAGASHPLVAPALPLTPKGSLLPYFAPDRYLISSFDEPDSLLR